MSVYTEVIYLTTYKKTNYSYENCLKVTNSFINSHRLTYTTVNIKTDAEEYSRSSVFCLLVFYWGKLVIALKHEEVDLERPLLMVLGLSFWCKILR